MRVQTFQESLKQSWTMYEQVWTSTEKYGKRALHPHEAAALEIKPDAAL